MELIGLLLPSLVSTAGLEMLCYTLSKQAIQGLLECMGLINTIYPFKQLTYTPLVLHMYITECIVIHVQRTYFNQELSKLKILIDEIAFNNDPL